MARCHVTDLSESPSSLPESASSNEGQFSPRVGVPFGVIEPLFAIADISIIVGAGASGGVLYQLALDGSCGDARFYTGLGLVASLAHVLAAHCLGLYRLNELLAREQDDGRVWTSWSVAILVLVVILFLFKAGAEASRGSILCLFGLGAVGLALSRRLAKRRLRSALMRGAIRGRRAILIGTQNELGQFGGHDLLVTFGLEEVDRVVLSRAAAASQLSQRLNPHTGTMLERVRKSSAEEVILALSWSRLADIELLLNQLRVVPLPVRLLPDRSVSTILRRQTSMPQQIYMVELQRTPLTRLECSAKRVLDVAVAATCLVFLAPVLLVAALAIKLESRGPVIFRQRRHGFNGKSFEIYKLRTMKVLEDGIAVSQARQRDPRVTRVGRFLRETSLDELPQLWNVLAGHMSVVGPRPHALIHDYEYGRMIANYAFRHHVKPGITGWAQVHGFRGGTPRLELMQQRITLDLWYIANWNLALDIYIIIKTFFEVIRRRNAY
jgi:Undecaprenyl-phosphate glucose phosphotransferase